MLRGMLKAKFRSWAAGQQLMVESIVGIQTVKASAVEPLFERKWEERLAAFVTDELRREAARASKRRSRTKFLAKLTSAGILFFGVLAVIDGSMTVGGLIAFNMISRLISKPIMRMSQL